MPWHSGWRCRGRSFNASRSVKHNSMITVDQRWCLSTDARKSHIYAHSDVLEKSPIRGLKTSRLQLWKEFAMPCVWGPRAWTVVFASSPLFGTHYLGNQRRSCPPPTHIPTRPPTSINELGSGTAVMGAATTVIVTVSLSSQGAAPKSDTRPSYVR
jgi:hypothetical protein